MTLGHEDVVRRSAGLFDEVILAVAMAHHKKTRFSLHERMAMATEATAGMGRIRVLPFEGLIMDFCREHGACAVVRGIRNITDFDYEAQMAAMNRKLHPAVETVFLLPQADLQCISSTLVREISDAGWRCVGHGQCSGGPWPQGAGAAGLKGGRRHGADDHRRMHQLRCV